MLRLERMGGIPATHRAGWAASDSVAAAIYGMAGIWPLQPPFSAAKQALMPLPPTEETTDERANIWVVIRTQARCKDP